MLRFQLIDGDLTDNNDGLTLIDVTDPERPTYCFIKDLESNLTPISAEQYVSNYYEGEDLKRLESLIHSFDTIPLLSRSVIDEAWWLDEHETSSESRKQDNPLKENVPSLVELTLKPAIEQAISEGKSEILGLILLDPSRVAVATDIIRSQNPVSDGAIALLQKLVSVGKDHSFDLSGFNLSGTQIVDLLAHCEGSEVTSLKLSHNPNLRTTDLEEILQRGPHTIRRMILFDTGISNAEIVLLLDTKPKLFYHLESIIHPVFLSGFYTKEPVIPSPRFTHAMICDSPWSVSLPYFTPNTLAQGLTDFLSPLPPTNPYDYSIFDGPLTGMAAYAACSRSRNPELAWGERTVAYVPRNLQWGNVMDLKKGEWMLVMGYDMIKYPKRKFFYAILRANKAGEEFLADENSPKTKTQDVLRKPEYVDVFDIRGFFKELEAEGRPAPDLGVLEKVFGIFPVSGDDQLFSFVGHEAIMEKWASLNG